MVIRVIPLLVWEKVSVTFGAEPEVYFLILQGTVIAATERADVGHFLSLAALSMTSLNIPGCFRATARRKVNRSFIVAAFHAAIRACIHTVLLSHNLWRFNMPLVWVVPVIPRHQPHIRGYLG